MERRVSQLGRVVLSVMPIIGCLQMPKVPSCGSEGTSAIVSGDWATGPRWPNEPAGFTVLSDGPFTGLNENGWRGGPRQTTNGSGLSLAADSGAPLSPRNVLQFTFAAGYTGGSEPGVEYYDLSTPTKETYYGFSWKPSNPWQSHPSGFNKIAFLFTASGKNIFIMLFNDGTGYTVQSSTQFAGDNRRLPPNRIATPVVLGAWHRIEWYVKYATTGTSRDGVVRWWLDGVLQGEYTDLQTPSDAGVIEYQLAPTWGGVGGMKTETDCYRFAHAHISRP